MPADRTRPPYNYNNTPEDVVGGLVSDSSPNAFGERIFVSVDELLEAAVVGIKVQRESVTTEVLNILNLKAAERMGLKGVDPSALIAAELQRRTWQEQTTHAVVIEQDEDGELRVLTRGN